jgi:hypothetical protein
MADKLFQTGIDALAIMEDMAKKRKPNDKPLITTVAETLIADVHPVIEIGGHLYQLGQKHPKTGRVYEADRVLRERGNQNDEWDQAHFQQNITALGDAPDIWEAMNDAVNDTGSTANPYYVYLVAYELINRVPTE